MSIAPSAATAPELDLATSGGAIPANVSPGRIPSIDLLRGAVMLLMTIDHTRDYFHAYSQYFSPTDLSHASAAIFLTRWITHFCAPVFVFLAGLSAYLSLSRVGDPARASRFLFGRGLLLVALEMTIVRFGWDFTLRPYFYAQIIWTLGWCMIVLSAVVALGDRRKGIGAARAQVLLAVLLFVSALLLDSFPDLGLWKVLVGNGVVTVFGKGYFVANYPILRWAMVMLAGYAIGPLFLQPRAVRRTRIVALGLSMTALFLILRFFNLADAPWKQYPELLRTTLSFLNCTKIPVSLPYLLMTLGPSLCLLAVLDFPAVESLTSGKLGGIVLTFGRVPLFFYLLHLYVIHGLSLIATALHGQQIHWVLPFTAFFPPPREVGIGFTLAGTYLAVLLVIALTYLPCRYMGDLKATKRFKWLRYL